MPASATELAPELSSEIQTLAQKVRQEARTVDAQAELVETPEARAERRAIKRLARLENAARAFAANAYRADGDLATLEAGIQPLRRAYSRAVTALAQLGGDPLEVDAAFDRLALAYYALEETVAYAAEPFGDDWAEDELRMRVGPRVAP